MTKITRTRSMAYAKFFREFMFHSLHESILGQLNSVVQYAALVEP